MRPGRSRAQLRWRYVLGSSFRRFRHHRGGCPAISSRRGLSYMMFTHIGALETLGDHRENRTGRGLGSRTRCGGVLGGTGLAPLSMIAGLPAVRDRQPGAGHGHLRGRNKRPQACLLAQAAATGFRPRGVFKALIRRPHPSAGSNAAS